MKKAMLCAFFLSALFRIGAESGKMATYRSAEGSMLTLGNDGKDFAVYSEDRSHERMPVEKTISYRDCPYKFVFLDGKAFGSDRNFRIFLVDTRTYLIKKSYFGDRLSDEDSELAAGWMKEQEEIDSGNRIALVIVAVCAVASTMIGILAFCAKA